MKKKKISRLASLLIGLPFMCLTLAGQIAVRNETRAVRPFEEMRMGKAELREPGEWPESGNVQLRADARAWPDSIVTFTAAGERQSKTVYAYDAAGNRILEESCTWESNTWVNRSKYVFAYDAAGNQTLFESYAWENDRWTESDKFVRVYDSRGVNLVWDVRYYWTNNEWMKFSEVHYDRKTVNSKVCVRVNKKYYQDGSRWDTVLYMEGCGLPWGSTASYDEKMEYQATYDANDNLTLVETTVLRDGKRVPFRRYVLEYGNNNSVSIGVYNYDGNDIGPMNRKATRTYDAGGNLTLSESYYCGYWDDHWDYWDYEKAEWTGYNKQVKTYDANGNQLSSKEYSWDTSSGGWIESSKNAYTYNANGKQLSYKYYWWDTSSGNWMMIYRYAYTYDANGNRLSYEYYNWDTFGGWGNKYVYMYDANGRELSYEYYNWDASSGGWEWAGYTVYYPGGSDPVATERIDGAEPSVYVHGSILYIQTVGGERISVYTPNGTKVYEQEVPAGTTAVSADRLPNGLLIVRGGSGWVKKVVK
jgi:hypothetical protein